MPEADFSLISDRTRDTESLKALTDLFSSFRCCPDSRLQSCSRTKRICPDSVLKCDRLNSLDYMFDIYPAEKAEGPRLFKITEPYLLKKGADLPHSPSTAFKCDHYSLPLFTLYADLSLSLLQRNDRRCRCSFPAPLSDPLPCVWLPSSFRAGRIYSL